MTTERLIKLPPLEGGDRFIRGGEFERRCAAMPNTRAAWIEGVVYL